MQKCLIVKEDGLIYAAEVPEKPSKPGPMDHQEFHKEYYEDDLPLYYADLDAAKESAVKCADQEKAIGLLYMNASRDNFQFRGDYVVGVKPGVYPIPDLQWEPRTVEKFYEGKGWFWETVAILKESTPSTEQESQEEKLIKLINLYWTFDDNQRHTHSWHDKQDCIEQIRTHFSITRKP